MPQSLTLMLGFSSRPSRLAGFSSASRTEERLEVFKDAVIPHECVKHTEVSLQEQQDQSNQFKDLQVRSYRFQTKREWINTHNGSSEGF